MIILNAGMVISHAVFMVLSVKNATTMDIIRYKESAIQSRRIYMLLMDTFCHMAYMPLARSMNMPTSVSMR